jgi:hypothetical protein
MKITTKQMKVFSIATYVISLIFTILLMISSTASTLGLVLVFFMAVILDGSKVLLFYMSLTHKNLNIIFRSILFILSIVLLISSIIASCGYILNESNKKTNIEIKQSDEYSQQQDLKNKNEELYNLKKQELENLKESHKDEVKNMTNILNGYPSNYITKKENLQKEINSLKEKHNILVSEKMNELKNLGSKEIKTSSNILNENGYTAIFKLFGNSLHKSSEEISLIFFMILSIVFEIIALISLYLSSIENVDFKLKNGEDLKPKDVEQKDNHKLSLLKGGLDVKKVKAYLEYMYENAENNISDGYIKISKEIGIKADEGRKIKSWLEGQGILKAEGGRTKIINKINIA